MLILLYFSSSLHTSIPIYRCYAKLHVPGKRMPAFVNGFLLDKDLPAREDKRMLTRLLGTTSDPDVRTVTVAEQQQLACVKISTDMVQPGRGVAYTRQYDPDRQKTKGHARIRRKQHKRSKGKER